MLNFVDRLGEWNPQMFRELKGRLKFFNVAIAVVTSLLLQLVIVLCQIGDVPDWQKHYQNIFFSLSIIFIFTLLVAGTYLLISDLAKEENRGTLNFIRLSPQSETSILTGKMLGVPSLIYLFIFLAIPLHLWVGISANIAITHIFSYYAILAASCTFFYSAALLFGLISRLFSNFQPWLGSGAVLLFLFVTMIMASSSSNYLNNPTAWFRMLSPWEITYYLSTDSFPNSYGSSSLKELQFFGLPVGANLISLLGFHLVNYGICTYGIWQGIKRSFRNPNSTILNKGQSYFYVACSQVILLGLAMQNNERDIGNQDSLYWLASFNFVIVLSLIIILSPHRQAVQDWARYRHQNVSSHESNKSNSLWNDLIWGEKSPALLAIAINLVITATPLIVWILLAYDRLELGNIGRVKALLSVAFAISLMLIYATMTQLILLMKTRKRGFWAIGTIAAAILLPPMLLGFLRISPSEIPILWLVSTFPWVAIESASTATIFMSLLVHLTVVTLLNFRLTRQVRLAGESATKALLAGR
ncbi:hypothetical protein NIES4074_44820 [Cylindrospermum sp. NIES-4074]|nr:hypothetical protein NIES4074_44820 [Cylindrospermum sp. NIES-4074]